MSGFIATTGTNQGTVGTEGNIETKVSGSSVPTLQILSYSHDNVSVNFDSYYSSGWKSSDSGSNFRIYKIGDRLRISYASGVSEGSTISDWSSQNNNVAMAIDTSGNVGIGTTNPGVRTVIQSGSSFSASGAVSKTADSATVSGSGTSFTTELNVGDTITVPGGGSSERRQVTAISNDTSLTVDVPFALSSSSETMTIRPGLLQLKDDAGDVRLTVSPAGDPDGPYSGDIGLDVDAHYIRIRQSASPSGNQCGAPGQICWDSSRLYVCTSTNSWKYVNLS